MVGAGNVTGPARTSAHARGGFHHGADHFRMLAHAKVIVRAPDHDRTRAIRGMQYCIRETPGNALDIGEHAVAPFSVKASKRRGKEMIIVHRNCPPGLCSTIHLPRPKSPPCAMLVRP
jgi:hypothetical protein